MYFLLCLLGLAGLHWLVSPFLKESGRALEKIKEIKSQS